MNDEPEDIEPTEPPLERPDSMRSVIPPLSHTTSDNSGSIDIGGDMTDQQLLFILEKKFSGCQFQSITFTEHGSMLVSFFDAGGNKHEQALNANNEVMTFEL